MKTLNLFETLTLISKSAFTGSASDSFNVNRGSRIFVTLNVTAIDPGASVSVKVKNGFSEDFPKDERLSFSLSAVGIKSRALSDFHNQFTIDVVVTGGNATFAVAVSTADNAQSSAASSGSGDVTPPPSDLAGIGHFADSSDTITPGAAQDLITETVPAGIQRQLSKLFVSCRFEGFYEVLLDGDVVGSGRTGPGNVNSRYEWTPVRPAEEGQEIIVRFTARAGAPATATVESHLQCTDVDSVG